MEINVMILGHTGLLGNMVSKYLKMQTGIKIIENTHRWPSDEFKKFIKISSPDYIINCIGAIHQRVSDFSINYDLPVWLSSVQSRIIHPGTDCEMDSDPYGISKKRASDFIKIESNNTKIIKTSIIGPELNSKYSLMSWFLSNPDGSNVNGFSNQYWNGNTTLTWANFCLELIKNWSDYGIENILYSDCISKYELLYHINKIWGRNIIINRFESPYSLNKCLEGNIRKEHIEKQLIELKEFYYNHD
jgi:dTDP-4-dehydrorhamnose reductase